MSPSGDYRRNIRPIILIGCFIWGLVLGFLAYTNSETAAQILEIAEIREQKETEKLQEELQEQKNQEVAQVEEFKKTDEVETPPEPVNILVKPEITIEEDRIIEPDFREAPVIQALSLEELPGLSGQTIALPVKPVEPVAAPVGNITTDGAGNLPKPRRNPFAEEDVVLDNVAPPELDD